MDPQKIVLPLFQFIGIILVIIILSFVIRLMAEHILLVKKKSHLNTIMTLSQLSLLMIAAYTGYLFPSL